MSTYIGVEPPVPRSRDPAATPRRCGCRTRHLTLPPPPGRPGSSVPAVGSTPSRCRSQEGLSLSGGGGMTERDDRAAVDRMLQSPCAAIDRPVAPSSKVLGMGSPSVIRPRCSRPAEAVTAAAAAASRPIASAVSRARRRNFANWLLYIDQPKDKDGNRVPPCPSKSSRTRRASTSTTRLIIQSNEGVLR